MAEELEQQIFFWTDEDILKYPELPKPVETWEMAPGETRKVRILRYGLYKHEITPRFYPAGTKKLTLALRIWVDPRYKPVGPPYWDIHQSHLIATLVPLLQNLNYPEYEFEITWIGSGPSARPQVKFTKITP